MRRVMLTLYRWPTTAADVWGIVELAGDPTMSRDFVMVFSFASNGGGMCLIGDVRVVKSAVAPSAARVRCLLGIVTPRLGANHVGKKIQLPGRCRSSPSGMLT